MFAPETYAARRSALARQLDGLIVILGNDNVPMNYAGNVYGFRQDGSFLYYGGLDEPGLALTIDADTGESVLYGHEPTLDDAIWEGPMASLGDRAAAIGIPTTAVPDALEEAVASARHAGRTVHVLPPYRAVHKIRLAKMLDEDASSIQASEPLIDAVIAQRLVKSDEEVAEIEKAVALAKEVHELAMSLAHPGRTEWEIAGAIEGHLAGQGGFPAFPIILTKHGETLHNHASGAVLDAGDLLLIDTGAVVPGTRYASDITRVAPVGGTFSDRQRDVYQIVLDAQTACIEGMAPGVPFRDLHQLAGLTLTRGLQGLGLMTGDAEEAVAAGAHALFMPHGLGHPMGLDVHDMEGLGEDRVGYDDEFQRSDQFGTKYLRFGRRLDAGHVMTVEPGCYFIPALMDVWQREGKHLDFIDYDALSSWRDFGGVRLEDDVLVTDVGFRVLGPEIPKAPEAVETIIRAGASA
ncbi:MAG: aminopeptidase P family protein [Bacteroidota bacterium]